MDIIFVRHGVPDYTLADQRQMSQLEKDYAPLDRTCIPFIKQQAENPVFSDADIILSSPYTRALQTAELLNRKSDLELFVEHDLREWRADLTGGYIKLDERDRRWHEYRTSLRYGGEPSGAEYETPEALKSRVMGVLNRYQNYNKIIVVAHFNVLESLLGYQENGIGCGEFRVFSFSHKVLEESDSAVS